MLAVLAGAAVMFALALLPTVGSAGRAFAQVSNSFQALGGTEDIRFPRFPERSTVYDVNGRVMATLFFDENRKHVKLDRINQVAREAVLAIEDTKFYEHDGVDMVAVARAALKNLLAGEIEQGASTITQQLARNAFPSVGTERTITRKVAEAQMALRIEQEYTKDEILELYLNRVYFGRGVYGIGTAAEYYFGTKAADLTLPQAATLAGLIASPEKYSPENDLDAATERRDQVLRRMARVGFITQEEADAAIAEPIELDITPPRKPKSAFFIDFIKRRFLEDERFGATREERKQILFQGGLKIHTTFDPKLERHGLKVIRGHLPLKEDPEAAIASIDGRTGAIRALVSSQRFGRSQVNLATGEGGTGRQVGSSFKVVTLLAALEQKIPQMKVYNGQHGQPVDCTPWGPPNYRANNADGSGGYMHLWEATRRSVNAVFVQLAVDAGVDNMIDVAKRAGIRSELPEVCSLTLGTGEVNALEMANVFQTISNQGKRCRPYAIARILKPNGKEFFKQGRDNCKQVIDKKVAITVANMLKPVVESGTGTAAKLGQWPVFGKTGSTNDLRDATFGGCTVQICSFVWVGHQKALIPMQNVHGQRVFGGTFPARIWHDFMAEVMKGQKPLDWPPAPKPEAEKVPDVVGMPQEKAERVLAKAGFTAVVKQVASNQPVGIVDRQNPPGGSSVTAG
ncbi:MAG TPA: transglycosylase domain-containing protein, partial [Actinomycetota bacterium]|nr:transglycosylase domain-containing protein [Actinomycetota bacterium]